jgi:hypothetical protein
MAATRGTSEARDLSDIVWVAMRLILKMIPGAAAKEQ